MDCRFTFNFFIGTKQNDNFDANFLEKFLKNWRRNCHFVLYRLKKLNINRQLLIIRSNRRLPEMIQF